MSEAIVAKRYADALFQLADDKNNVEEILSELAVVKDVFQANDKLVEVLQHPQIKIDDKMKLIGDAFSKCEKDVVNTLKILVERGRIEYISEIIEHFSHLYNDAKGIALATVYSVRELSEDEKANMESSLTKQLNKQKVLIENVIDPSVLGGMKIRVGNTIYDGSVNGKLHRMNQIIASSNI